MIRAALIGNPNVGKTEIFNRLTGLSQNVGNFPGVTVEKKAGRLAEGLRAALPGAELRLRVHRAGLTDDLRSDDVFRWSALVKVKAGPFVHVRAYAMPDGNR